MPYKLNGKCVVNVATGETVPGGCHATRAGAVAHLRALYSNVPDATKADEQSARPNGVVGIGGDGDAWGADIKGLGDRMRQFTNTKGDPTAFEYRPATSGERCAN